MEAIDRYIDIVYNDRYLSEDEADDMDGDVIANIFLGLIKRGKYAQAEEIMEYDSLFMIYPIKMRKYKWKNPNNINRDNLYVNEKNITGNSRELYNSMFMNKNFPNPLITLNYNIMHSEFLIKDKRLLKILRRGGLCDYSPNLHVTEELTPYLYSKFYKHKINEFYCVKQIYELRILQKFHMLNMPSILHKFNINVYIIMNYENDNINDVHLTYRPKILKFIFN